MKTFVITFTDGSRMTTNSPDSRGAWAVGGLYAAATRRLVDDVVVVECDDETAEPAEFDWFADPAGVCYDV